MVGCWWKWKRGRSLIDLLVYLRVGFLFVTRLYSTTYTYFLLSLSFFFCCFVFSLANSFSPSNRCSITPSLLLFLDHGFPILSLRSRSNWTNEAVEGKRSERAQPIRRLTRRVFPLAHSLPLSHLPQARLRSVVERGRVYRDHQGMSKQAVL